MATKLKGVRDGQTDRETEKKTVDSRPNGQEGGQRVAEGQIDPRGGEQTDPERERESWSRGAPV